LSVFLGSLINSLFSFYSFGGYLSSITMPKADTQVKAANVSTDHQNVNLICSTIDKPLEFITYKNLET
jgi:hypothetical protein